MGNLSEFLMEELNVATAFTIPIFGGIEVAESTVISWVIMAIIVILTLVLTRNMKVENPGKLPMVLIEVQTGAYLGEDDIIRYEDVYARGQGAKG